MGSYEDTMLKLEKMASANTAKQFDWQERMSNTSHQREVKDLVAAGLNPVLSSGGSGAQSYTTSVDSAVNGIANMASAREGANATRYAAQLNASAMRAAAAANLAAAREAAAASRYSADQHLAGVKYSTNNSKSGSAAGILENFFKQTQRDNTGIGRTMSQLWKQQAKNPSSFFRDKNNQTFDGLNTSGRNLIQKTLRNVGISLTRPNQQIVFKALWQNNASAKRTLTAWMTNYNRKVNSAASNWSNRVGSGVW